MQKIIFSIFIIIILSFPLNALAFMEDDETEIIGKHSNGCIVNSAELPINGYGYQHMRLSRKRNYGHPLTIGYIENLAKRIKDELGGYLLVGDISPKKGGPMRPAHGTHQTGLDIDFWFWYPEFAPQRLLTREEREKIGAPSLVKRNGSFYPQYNPNYYPRILKLAAESPLVSRILVNPSIKRDMCNQFKGQKWLRLIRPWYGHDDHFHVQLKCPEGSDDCEPPVTIPEGDGCGADLAWWFTKEPWKTYKDKIKKTPPPLPQQCQKLLGRVR